MNIHCSRQTRSEVDGKTLVNSQPVSNGFTTDQVVLTLDQGTLRLFHNDVLVTLNGAVSASLKSGKITIGEFPGRIWDILVYDRVLTNLLDAVKMFRMAGQSNIQGG